MANRKFLWGMLSAMLVFGLTLGGCSEDSPETPPPYITGTVTIIGTPNVGAILSVDISELGGSGTPSYQWMRDSTDIGGATSSTYTVTTSDVGKTLKVIVKREGYSGFVIGSIDPILTGIVTITGNPRRGMVLSADTSELGGSGTISYQWMRDSTDIGGATSSNYTVQELDFGRTLKVKVSRYGYSGSIEAQIAVPSPQTYTIILKKTGGTINTGGSLQKIIVEDANGSQLAQTPQAVTSSPTTISVTSYDSQFKIRIEWTLIGNKYYFKTSSDPDAGELFDFHEGTTTYSLTYSYLSPVYYGLVATEE